ncbi:MAG TPA: hypothetical protein VE544_11955 [Nitrososphaeraceae archaeon]|jgi:hypothetical protein|nr:hypothetical protein [Nitrososphaeraceae archaeon]
MNKVAIFVFADTKSEEGLGRVVNALETAKEFKNEQVRLYFDGTGTKWPAELAKEDHIAHKLYESVTGSFKGACSFCAAAFGAKESIKKAGVQLVDEHDNHISVKKLLSEGFHVLNF